MCIPYGAVAGVAGLAASLLGGGRTALLIAAAGAVQLALSAASLGAWRAQRSCLPATAASAGALATPLARLAGEVRPWAGYRQLPGVSIWPQLRTAHPRCPLAQGWPPA
jgi:hypothetical protein